MNILAKARAILGVTQEEMADRLGISRRTYQRRERIADEFVPRGDVALAREAVFDAADAALRAEAEEGGFRLEAVGPRRYPIVEDSR